MVSRTYDVIPGGAWLRRSFGRHQGSRTTTATSFAAMIPTAGALGSLPEGVASTGAAGNSSARITGATIAHQTIARCADIASRKNTPSQSSVVQRVGVPRRARIATTASAEPIMNKPETSVAVTGAHSLIVSRMMGLVERSYAYRHTSTPNGVSNVAATVARATQSSRREPGTCCRASWIHASPTTSGKIVKLPWTLAQTAASTGIRYRRRGAISREAIAQSATAKRGKATSCGRIARVGEATRNPATVRRLEVRTDALRARQAM